MIAALPLNGASLPAATAHPLLANGLHANTTVDLSHADQTATQQASNCQQPQAIPNDVEAFYTVGNDPLAIACQPANMNTSNLSEFHDPKMGCSELSCDPNASQTGGNGSQSFQGGNHDGYANSANLFVDSLHSLQAKGGPSDPLAMLKFQAQLVETTLNWTLYGQMASKAVSGIQSLFNNQV